MAGKKSKPSVGIVMGSDSDWETLQHTVSTLEAFGVACEVQVASAHRTPERAIGYASNAQKNGLKVLIAAAGGAAHLAGVVAGHTTLPVIGIPVKGWALDGLDSLLSTVQMPGGIPVATVAIGKAGAVNAAILATQILALSDPALQKKLRKHKQDMVKKVEQGNQRLAKLRRS
jgi:phosphoribosylaminoimidazole carboxylase PurE protein